MGASILMAKYYGAKKYEDLKEEMATSIGAGLLLTLVLSLLILCGKRAFYPSYTDTGGNLPYGGRISENYFRRPDIYLFL